MAKIVALCGSMRFAERMQEVAEGLELERGWAVLSPVMHVLPRALTEAEAERLGNIHRAKIDLAEAVYVVNVGGYIGEAVRAEIAYARARGKEIMFLETE